MNRHTDEQEYEGGLARLGDLDYLEIADNTKDVRGWEVYGKGGRRIGQVRQLVVDPVAMKVRYLETRIHNSERRILVPIEGVLLDLQEQRVLLPLAASDTGALPPCPLEVTHDFDRVYDAEWTRRWGKPLSDDVTLVRLRRC